MVFAAYAIHSFSRCTTEHIYKTLPSTDRFARFAIRSAPRPPSPASVFCLALHFGAITGNSYNAKHETSLKVVVNPASPMADVTGVLNEALRSKNVAPVGRSNYSVSQIDGFLREAYTIVCCAVVHDHWASN